VAIVLGLVLLFMAKWLGLGPFASPEPPPPVASSPSPPTPRRISGQEVAPSGPPPEIERAAAPPPEETTPAAVASPATRPKDDALKKQNGTLSPVARWCLGAAAAANTACPASQVRPTPAAQECPDGAVETMTGTLGLRIGSKHTVHFPNLIDSMPVTVREGFTSMEMWEGWGKLPRGTFLSGQLHFGEGHIYGRFTEARTPTGDTFKVCIQIFTEGNVGKRGGGLYKPGPGTEMEPGSTPDNVLMFSLQRVMTVRRFD
jgi:eukaryotic-like serine/threonine-protein kinase